MAGPQDNDWDTDITIPIGTWTHLAVTYDGSQIRLWKDGNEVASKAASGSLSLINKDQPLFIAKNTTWGEFFNGTLDEVRVYNRALNQTEIQAVIESGSLSLLEKALMILRNWGGSGSGDINGDGKVNGMDFGYIVKDWP